MFQGGPVLCQIFLHKRLGGLGLMSGALSVLLQHMIGM